MGRVSPRRETAHRFQTLRVRITGDEDPGRAFRRCDPLWPKQWRRAERGTMTGALKCRSAGISPRVAQFGPEVLPDAVRGRLRHQAAFQCRFAFREDRIVVRVVPNWIARGGY